MRLLTAGLQVRVLLAEPFDSPRHNSMWWGVSFFVAGLAQGFALQLVNIVLLICFHRRRGESKEP